MESNSRIPLPEEKGPQQAQRQMDRLYARHQPYQFDRIYYLPDHPGDKTIFVENLKWMQLLWRKHFHPGPAGFLVRNNPFLIRLSFFHQ